MDRSHALGEYNYISDGKHLEAVRDRPIGRNEILCLQWETFWTSEE